MGGKSLLLGSLADVLPGQADADITSIESSDFDLVVAWNDVGQGQAEDAHQSIVGDARTIQTELDCLRVDSPLASPDQMCEIARRTGPRILRDLAQDHVLEILFDFVPFFGRLLLEPRDQLLDPGVARNAVLLGRFEHFSLQRLGWLSTVFDVEI